jgi:hypothetical protein
MASACAASTLSSTTIAIQKRPLAESKALRLLSTEFFE